VIYQALERRSGKIIKVLFCSLIRCYDYGPVWAMSVVLGYIE
jgi:hypothetical protein